jgi:solute:Na+ symporter, SSS family
MTADLDFAALAVFVLLLGLVMVMGIMAARWRRPKTLAHLDEWGLGGRQFGTWITWFLIGGDVYTAYTMIAVPALVYAAGAYGFFALPLRSSSIRSSSPSCRCFGRSRRHKTM